MSFTGRWKMTWKWLKIGWWWVKIGQQFSTQWGYKPWRIITVNSSGEFQLDGVIWVHFPAEGKWVWNESSLVWDGWKLVGNFQPIFCFTGHLVYRQFSRWIVLFLSVIEWQFQRMEIQSFLVSDFEWCTWLKGS